MEAMRAGVQGLETPTVQASPLLELCAGWNVGASANKALASPLPRLICAGALLTDPPGIPCMSQDGGAIVKANKGKPPTAYGAFLKLADRLGPPPEPVPDAPQQLPSFKAGAPRTSGSEMEVPTLQDINYHQAPTTSFVVSIPALPPFITSWAAMAEDLVPQAQLCAASQESGSAASGLAPLFFKLVPPGCQQIFHGHTSPWSQTLSAHCTPSKLVCSSFMIQHAVAVVTDEPLTAHSHAAGWGDLGAGTPCRPAGRRGLGGAV